MGRKSADEKREAADESFSVQNTISSVCVSFLHGFSGEVLAEVSHDVESVDGGGGEDAGGRLETEVCGGSVGDEGTKWGGGDRTEKRGEEGRTQGRQSK